LDFDIREEQQLIINQIGKIVKSFPDDYWRMKDSKAEFPVELWQKLASGGWFGLNIPVEYGGAGLGMLELSLAVQAVAQSGAGVMGGNLFTVACGMVPNILVQSGSIKLKDRFLPLLAKGQLVCSIVMTEPGAGVDTFGISTFAEKNGDEYRLNGQKIWITFAPVSDLMLVLARTTPKSQVKLKTEGLSLFLLETKKAGLKIERIEDISMRPLGSSTVYFDDTSIPAENLVGEEDMGWRTLAPVLNAERICTTSHVLGTGELVLEKATDYAKQRVVFGRPIGQNQGIQFPLADSKGRLEVARLMLLKAAWLYDRGRNCTFEAQLAGYVAAQAAFEAADRAIQTYGGMGFAVASDIERHWRDLRLWRTAPVPEQMVLSYIAHHVLGLPRSF